MKIPECCYLHKAIVHFEEGIRAYIHNRIDDPVEAADIAQEVFLKIAEAHARDARVENVKSWIYSLTNNTIADHYRKKYRSGQTGEHPSAHSFLPEITEEECGCEYVLPLIDLLEEKYRLPLLLHDIDQLPQKEVAVRLQLSLPAVKSRILRARQQLRELFLECTHVHYDNLGNVLSVEIRESCTPLKKLIKKP